jgi:cytoskeletal protein RodZ
MAEEAPSRDALGTLALELKNERVRRNLSVDEIGRLVNISTTHIEKIEGGDFTFLPPLYAFSYLRKYAGELGIGDESLLAACRKQLQTPAAPAFNPGPDVENSGDSGSPTTRRMLLLASAALLLLIAAFLISRAF